MDLLARVVRRPLAGLLAVVTALTAAAGLVPARAEEPVLVETGRRQLSPRLLELTLRTPALAADTKARVLLPAGYTGSERRYPVLYLLNGGAGSYGDDGSGQAPRWESYHVGQLLPWVDRHFRTTGARAVAGMSMGGNGALHYAARHPQLFAAAASFSGAVDVLDPVMTPITETTGVADGALPGAVFGPRLTEEIRWRASNPIDLAANLRHTWLSLATGDGSAGGPDGGGLDPVERIVHDENVLLHDRLTALGIAHAWDDYGPGGHVWFYWQRELRDVLPALVRVLQQPRRAPAAVTHWAVEPSYDVWGWSVRLTRPVLEASQLVGARRDGFVLRGTGTATVTTAPLYRPNQPVAVTVADAAGTRTLTLRAGRDRRLVVPVDLGPANPIQQYTVPTQSVGTAVREARVTVSLTRNPR